MALGNVGSMAVALLGDMKDFDKKMDGATKKVSTFDKTVGKMGKAVTKAAKLAAAAAATAVVAFGASAVKTFVEFDTEMRNVFTLMPDLSAEAREAMEEDVKALAEQIGVLPNEVIPALYQALSAGVPQENVFEYMAVAGETAIGGTIALEDAVVGLAQVMNAYGAEVDTVRDYSDIMFSIVRDGITTMEELSGELFKVAPVAADLGIAFSSIAGWAAELTSQGVPTAEAFSYMKVALNELSKTGTIASDTFEKAAGVTFPAFIDAGGDLAGAFEIIDDYASDAGISVKDMFGSIEAGGAVLQATGVHFDSFTKKVNNAEEAGGNTRAAYEEMAAGVRHELDKLAVWWQNLKLDIGGDLTENLQDLLGWLQDNREAIGDGIKATFDAIIDGLAWLKDNADAVKKALIVISVGLAAIVVYTNPLVAIAAAIAAIVLELNKADTSTVVAEFDNLRDSVDSFLRVVDQADQGQVNQFLNKYRAAVLEALQASLELRDITDDVYVDLVNQVLTLDEAVAGMDTESQITAFMDGADAILASTEALETYQSTSVEANETAADAVTTSVGTQIDAIEEVRRALAEYRDSQTETTRKVVQAVNDEREARSSLTADEIAALDALMAARTQAALDLAKVNAEIKSDYEQMWEGIKNEAANSLEEVAHTFINFADTREEEEKTHQQNLQDIRDEYAGKSDAALQTALGIEESAYKQHRTTIAGTLRDMFGDFISYLSDQLLAMAAAETVKSIAAFLSLNPVVGTASALAAGQYAVGAAGVAILASSIPGYAEGGLLPGPIGSPQIIMAHGGEEVSTPEQQAARGIDYELLGQAVAAGFLDALEDISQGPRNQTTVVRLDPSQRAQALYGELQMENERRGGAARLADALGL